MDLRHREKTDSQLLINAVIGKADSSSMSRWQMFRLEEDGCLLNAEDHPGIGIEYQFI